MTGGMSGLGDMDELYEAIILDHYRSPRNTAPVEEASQVGITGRGCAISQASASLLAELVEGKSTEQVHAAVDSIRRLLKGEEITDEEADVLGDIEALGGVRKFPVRIKCALLSWVGLDDALKEHQGS
jgi:nitrogen fixation NifU-like protein